MSVKKQLEKHFSEESLKKIFSDHIVYSGAVGIDNLDQNAFRKQLDNQVKIISRKTLAGSYKFTKYKLKLVSKGRGKVPREISIPTVRDRIALRAMCNFLTDRYKGSINFCLPQEVIKRVKREVSSGIYDGCIKLDVTNFYPSVNHGILTSRLRSKIRTDGIINIILSAVTSPTVSISRPSDTPSTIGVPQGLAVSNMLAAIYLGNIDKYLNEYPNIKYYRYVDDVLILCDKSDAKIIAGDIIKRFSSKTKLKIHDPIKVPDKSQISPISYGFDYLGYKFKGPLITARQGTIENLKTSLVSIFTAHKHSKYKDEAFLLWRLNLRITGCVFENKSKGWLFFFSEINDEKLLHSLDHHVKKLCARFNTNITPKKFVRSFKELSHRKYETNYIPNFDTYNIEQIKELLLNYFKINTSKLNDEEIIFIFHKKIGKQVKDLLVDVKNFTS
jgi:hypothetical protein